jgi:hypothetical protein
MPVRESDPNKWSTMLVTTLGSVLGKTVARTSINLKFKGKQGSKEMRTLKSRLRC